MTLTICIIAKDGIVLTSDSRAIDYLTSNDTVKKIFRLDDHHAVGIAGDGPLAMTFIDRVSPKLNFRHGLSEIAEQIRRLGKDIFDEWFSHQKPEDRPALTILLAGYTSDDKPEIYKLNSKDNFAPRKSTTGFDCIGIPVIANYVLNRLYEPDITVKAATELGTFCIKETSSQDFRVGGPTQIGTFSQRQRYEELPTGEIDEIEKRCEQVRLMQKVYFYPETPDVGPPSSAEAKKKPAE